VQRLEVERSKAEVRAHMRVAHGRRVPPSWAGTLQLMLRGDGQLCMAHASLRPWR
jgi:hypothetical protein